MKSCTLNILQSLAFSEILKPKFLLVEAVRNAFLQDCFRLQIDRAPPKDFFFLLSPESCSFRLPEAVFLVHKKRHNLRQSLFINFVEVIVRKINFATHVKNFLGNFLQLKRNVFNGLHIGSDFIALETITSGYHA